RRGASRRQQLSNTDRLAFVWLYRLCPSVLGRRRDHQTRDRDSLASTRFQGLLAVEVRSRGGRPAIPREIRELIREMSRANWLWGAPRIIKQNNALQRSVRCG